MRRPLWLALLPEHCSTPPFVVSVSMVILCMHVMYVCRDSLKALTDKVSWHARHHRPGPSSGAYRLPTSGSLPEAGGVSRSSPE